jgi:hypothetical protein
MDALASLFVQKPLHIVLVALVFLAGYLALRFTAKGARRHPRGLLVPPPPGSSTPPGSGSSWSGAPTPTSESTCWFSGPSSPSSS